MRSLRTQPNPRRSFRFVLRLLFSALAAAWLGDCASALAQSFTYADQVAYYETSSARIQIETPAGYEPGVRDDLNSSYLPDLLGPVSYSGSYGGVSEIPGMENESINFVRLTDDIGADGIAGAIVIVDPVSGLLTTMTDFDDLHTFNIAFDQVGVARQYGLREFDTGGVYWVRENGSVRPDPDQVTARRAEAAVSNLPIDSPKVRRGTGSRTVFVRAPRRSQIVPQYSKFAADRRGSGIGMTYGYCECALYDRFRFDAEGGILGRTFSDTRANSIVTGPQVGIVGFDTFGPLTIYAHSLFVIGANDGDLRQNNGIGAELVPGATNRLLYAQPTYSEHQAAFAQVSPAAVYWAEASLQITEQTSFKVAVSTVFVNNVLLAEERVRFYLPDMGFRDPGDQNYAQQTFYCGIEMIR